MNRWLAIGELFFALAIAVAGVGAIVDAVHGPASAAAPVSACQYAREQAMNWATKADEDYSSQNDRLEAEMWVRVAEAMCR